jgi:hypothetical protein
MIKRSTKLCLEWAAGFLAGILVVLLVLGLRLSQGPIDLNFLNGSLAEILAMPERGLYWQIEKTDLAWDNKDRAPQLRVHNLQLFNADKRAVATLPDLAVGLSLRALLYGRLAPGSITLLQPSITITRSLDGRIGLAAQADLAGDNTMPAPDFLAAALAGLAERPDVAIPALQYLYRLDIRDGEILWDDQQQESALWVPAVNLSLGRNRQGLFGLAELEIELDEKRTTFAGNVTWQKDSDSINMSGDFSHIDLGKIAALIPPLRDFALLQTTLSGNLQFALGGDLNLREIILNAQSPEGRLQHPRYFKTPLPLQDLQLQTHFRPETGLVVDELRAKLAGADLSLRGKWQPGPDATAIALQAGLKNLDIRKLGELWPEDLGANPRAWVVPNIQSGVLQSASIDLTGHIGTGETDITIAQLTGRIDFENAEIDYRHPMPKATGVNGYAEFDADRMTIYSTGGQLGELQLGAGKTVIDGLSAKDQTLRIEAAVSGKLAEALRVLDSEPLRLPSKRDLAPAQTSGEFAGKVMFAMPLVKDLLLADVTLAAEAQGNNIRVNRVFGDKDLTGGDLKIVLSQEKMEISGTAQLHNFPISLLWQEDFRDTPPAARSRYVVNIKGQAESIVQKLALDLPVAVSGVVAVDVDYRIQPKGDAEALVTADLTDAALGIAEVNYWKPVGQKAAARAELLWTKNGDLQRIRQAQIQAADADIQAQADFAPGGKLTLLQFTKLQSPTNNARLTVRRDGENSYAVTVQGEKFDAGYLWDQNDGKDGGNYSIDVDLNRLQLGGQDDLHRVRGRIVSRGPITESVRLNATTGEGAGVPLLMQIIPQPAGRRLLVKSDDAGGALRALNIYDNMRGGKLQIEGVYKDPGRDVLTALLRVENFNITRAPILGQLLNLSSLSGIMQNLSGQGIKFDKFTADFTQQPGLVTLKTARLSGASIGIKTSGTIDTKNDLFDLEGVLAPANALNKIVSEIPLIGGIITMGGEQPLFGFNFTIRDRIDAPKVSVNPLSALTPGILREVFGGN